MSPSTFVKKLVIFSDSILRLSPRSSSWSIMTVDADMFVARTLSPRSCTAILASASSRDRGMTFSDAYMSGSNCLAIPATFATSGIKPVVHGCKSSQEKTRAVMVQTRFALDLVKRCMPFATDDSVSSMGAVRNSVSPRIANRTTTCVSTGTARTKQRYVHPSKFVASSSGDSSASSSGSSHGLCRREAMLAETNLCSYSGMGSGLVRGVMRLGDSGNGMRDGVTSRSVRHSKGERDVVERRRLSLSSDLRYQWLFDFCQAGGAHGPSDSVSDSSASWGMLQRDECMAERPL